MSEAAEIELSTSRPIDDPPTAPGPRQALPTQLIEILLLILLCLAYAGDRPPMVNEAHYLVKAKNFWQPEWCANDLLAASQKAHVTFNVWFGWPSQFVSLPATAWLGRLAGWTLLAVGLQRLTSAVVGVRYASLAVAAVWVAGIEYGNLAGEWVVGGIEAKVPAYGFVLLGLSCIARRRWDQAWICLGAAAAFHVLTGGWSVVAASLAWWASERRRSDRKPFFSWSLAAGGALALCGLVPALALTLQAGAGEAAEAARIYTYFRLRHHLLPADFSIHWYLRHGLLVLVTAATASIYWRRDQALRRVGWFAAGAVAIALTGLLIGLLPPLAPDLAARLLRYYWFRLSDAVVPLYFGLLVAWMCFDSDPTRRWTGRVLLSVACALIVASVYPRLRLGIPPAHSNQLVGLPTASIAQQRQTYRDWLAVCRWANASTPVGEIFLTPRHQTTFKWYAQRAEVVNWKDVPQDAGNLVEWLTRFRHIYPQRLGHVRVTVRYDTLREIRDRFGVRYMIVDRRIVGDRLPLVRVYPTPGETNETYAVYQLPTVDRELPAER